MLNQVNMSYTYVLRLIPPFLLQTRKNKPLLLTELSTKHTNTGKTYPQIVNNYATRIIIKGII